jgi:hypothetical protein
LLVDAVTPHGLTTLYQVPPELAPIFGVVAASAIIILETFLEFILRKFRESRLLDVLFMQYDLLHVGIVHAGSGMIGMFLTAFLNRYVSYD